METAAGHCKTTHLRANIITAGATLAKICLGQRRNGASYRSRPLWHNPLKRYSLGTKNKTLQYNADGSLTIYAGATSPGKDKETNWRR